MSLADWLIGVPVALVIMYFLAAGVVLCFTELLPFIWQVFRFERKGICPACHQRYGKQLVALANDQTYGSGYMWRDVCPNGHQSITHGNRRFADWSDF